MRTHYFCQFQETDMIESVITAKSQTTLPSGVRKALGVGPGDRLAYVVEGDRAIIMKVKPNDAHEDPVADAFLAFLERGMKAHPEHLAGLTAELVERARALTDGIEVDLDATLEGDVAI
jgi:antitoxin PrlF